MKLFRPDGRLASLSRRSATIDFNAPHVVRRFLILVPLLFGLWSVLLGPDANYDLYNYHLYNAFAFLNDKLRIDFAPAGSQTYFNPSLDIGYYLLNTHVPPRLAGFLMGCLHGLNFLLVYGVARKTLSFLPAQDRLRIPLFLAIAGSLTGNFLSEIGSTMGDNSTALFSLGALYLILSCWDRLSGWSWQAVALSMAAGLVAGVGIGLKLTNAVYALALCAALLWYPAKFQLRVALAFCFGVAVLLGLALSGGYWFWAMWQEFRNPLFPQFSAFFPNALTSSVTITDLRWRPANLLETLCWPLVFSFSSGRVAEMGGMRQIIWAVAYLLLILTVLRWLYARIRARALPPMDARARYVLVYVVLGFVLWMELFSIYRYIVPIELLAPLVIYLLFTQCLPPTSVWKFSFRTILACTLLVVLGGSPTWGHEGWADRPFYAELPPLANPAKTMVILPGGDPPLAWLAVLFPREVAFAQLYSYPPGPGFAIHLDEMTAQRSEALYGVFEGRYDSRADSIRRINALTARFGLNSSPTGCQALHWATEKFHLRAAFVPGGDAGALCQLQARAADLVDVDAENLAARNKKRPLFEPNRLKLIDESCRNYKSGIGNGVKIFQLCKLERLPQNP